MGGSRVPGETGRLRPSEGALRRGGGVSGGVSGVSQWSQFSLELCRGPVMNPGEFGDWGGVRQEVRSFTRAWGGQGSEGGNLMSPRSHGKFGRPLVGPWDPLAGEQEPSSLVAPALSWGM